MWVIKARGETYYVNHVTCEIPWSTKETPNNSHTKGSIKIKRCLITIDSGNCATISTLTKEDETRLSSKTKIYRIITSQRHELKKFLENRAHGAVKTFGGACSTTWYVTDLYSESVLLLAQMAVSDLRVLMPNEAYYHWYDKYADEYVDLDALDYEDLYED